MSELIGDELRIPADLSAGIPSEVSRGEIPMQAGPDSRLYSQRKGGELGAEQLRALQAQLMDLQSQRPFKRLLITSAMRQEGKTHLAANLALAFATEGARNVLIVDTDVRNPSLQGVLGMPASQGLKDWLLNGGNPWKFVKKIKRTNLYLMPAGIATCETLGPSRIPCLQSLLDQLAPSFDLVVLDSPPLLGTTDAKLLSTVTDAVLIVVRAGSTPRQLVQKAQEALDGQNILGVALNRLDPSQDCFNSYYGQTSPEKVNPVQDEGKVVAAPLSPDVIRVVESKNSTPR